MCRSLGKEEENYHEARLFTVHVARAYAVLLLKFSLKGKKKKKRSKKNFGLTKLSHKTFKVLWHHKLKTMSQILCDINM